MKNKAMLLTVISALIILSCAQAYAASVDTTNRRETVQEEIWALEEAYFTNLYKANYEGVLALVHSQFLGWPGSVSQPMDKDESARFMRKLISRPSSCTIRIERHGLRFLNDVVLTQYILHVNCSDASGVAKTQSSRITHTWVKEGLHWKLLGGMSYDHPVDLKP
jgi:hypothetical protein